MWESLAAQVGPAWLLARWQLCSASIGRLAYASVGGTLKLLQVGGAGGCPGELLGSGAQCDADRASFHDWRQAGCCDDNAVSAGSQVWGQWGVKSIVMLAQQEMALSMGQAALQAWAADVRQCLYLILLATP